MVIARTGWDEPATTVVSLTCAPRGGQRCALRIRKGEREPGLSHAHTAYNAITLFSNGQHFIVPRYERRSSRFQNTVAVNDTEFLTNAGLPIRMVAFRSEQAFTYAAGDATAAFPANTGVDYYRRHLVLWKPLTDQRGEREGVFLFDELRCSRGLGDFKWTLHGDPRVHRVRASGGRMVWEALPQAGPARGEGRTTSTPTGSPPRPLTVDIFEPEAFAWEHARLDSQNGTGMLEAHRVLRTQWRSNRMHVLAAFSTGDSPRQLPVMRTPQLLAVATGDRPAQPLVGFALAPLRLDDLRKVQHPLLRNRELILFGHDPEHPDVYLSMKDAKIRVLDGN